MSVDIRWKQRFSNYERALERLSSAVKLSTTRSLTDLEKQGLIQAFEFTHELAWNVMKDYLEQQGITALIGSKDASREAFKQGIIQNGDPWMEMIKSRNQSSHTYNEDIMNEIITKIIQDYSVEFQAFSKKMSELAKK